MFTLERLRAWLAGRRPPLGGAPHDPYAAVREPRKRGPGGRNSSVAVAEPEPDQFVSATARSRHHSSEF